MGDYETEIEETGENTFRLKIGVPPEVVSAAVDAEYRRYSREVKMPGFRKGKVPKRVIEARYGKSILDDVVGDIVAESLDATIRELELDIIGTPGVNVEPYGSGGKLVYTADVDVYPEFKLPEITPILSKVKVREPKITEKDVDAALENLRATNATLEPVTDRPSEDGDMVILRFLAETPPGFGSETFRIWADKNPDNFAGRQVIGHITGDTFSLVVKYPENFGDKSVAGSERSEPVEVIEIKTPVLPEIDEDFAADLGFDDLSALKDDVRRNLSKKDAARARSEAYEELISKLAGKTEVPMSNSFVERAALETYGVNSFDDLENVSKEEALRKAREYLTHYIITRKLAEERSVKVKREEVEAFRNRIAETEQVRIPYSAAYEHIINVRLTDLLFGNNDDVDTKPGNNETIASSKTVGGESKK